MPFNFTAPTLLAPNQQGVQVQGQTDWDNLLLFMQQTAGFAIAFGQGYSNGNAIPQFQALDCVPAGGMVVSVGGSSGNPNVALIQGILSWDESSTQFTVPNNGSGQTRIDLICVQPEQEQDHTVTRNLFGGGTASVPYDYSGINYQYVTGTPGGGVPSVPSGFSNFAELTIPTGTSTITTGMIAVQFPVMNPTGPTGPAGPGFTTTTGSINIPNVGGTANVTVLNPTGWVIGVTGSLIGTSKAMYFIVTGVSGSTLTLMNLGPVEGYSNTGTVSSGANVACGDQPPCYLTSSTPLDVAGTGLTLDVNTVAQWNETMYGMVFGTLGSPQGFLFKITPSGVGSGTLDIIVLAVVQGSIGGTISAGAYVIPIPPPSIYSQDGSQSPGAEYTLTGVISDPGNGGIAPVTFSLDGGTNTFSFLMPGNYRFNGLTPLPPSISNAFVPQIIAKTATGFTVQIPSSPSTGHGDIEWSVTGTSPF